MIRLRLSAYGIDPDLLKNEVDSQIETLKTIIPENIFGYGTDSLAGVVGKMLAKNGKTLAVAESCTGGNIAHLFTSNPGSSAYFKGAIVAYSNEIKTSLLEVKQETLALHGAVSEEVAIEMVLGAKKILKSDYAIATTGIAGPDGGTSEKPVGTVWIAVAGKQNVIVKRYNFAHNRERNILRSSQSAINMLRELILTDNSNSI